MKNIKEIIVSYTLTAIEKTTLSILNRNWLCKLAARGSRLDSLWPDYDQSILSYNIIIQEQIYALSSCCDTPTVTPT